jgi:hypothetical protein
VADSPVLSRHKSPVARLPDAGGAGSHTLGMKTGRPTRSSLSVIPGQSLVLNAPARNEENRRLARLGPTPIPKCAEKSLDKLIDGTI